MKAGPRSSFLIPEASWAAVFFEAVGGDVGEVAVLLLGGGLAVVAPGGAPKRTRKFRRLRKVTDKLQLPDLGS